MNGHYSYMLYIMLYIDGNSLCNASSGFNSRISLLDLEDGWSFTRKTRSLWCLK